jgi:hypothetical protein
MKSNHIRLFTPFPPEECIKRLNAAIDTSHSALISWALFYGSKPVVGYAKETSFWLMQRKRYGNSFKPLLTASMRPEDGGTLISGTFAMHPLVRAFLFLWFGGALIMGGILFVFVVSGTLTQLEPHQNTWLAVVVPPLVLAGGFGLIGFGRYLARNESKFLKDFLIQTLIARAQDQTS